jgi:hypothetical protein
MNRVPLIPLAVALLLAGASGCASRLPGTAAVPEPASAVRPDGPPQAEAVPEADVPPAAIAEATDRSPPASGAAPTPAVAAARKKSAARGAPPPRAAEPPADLRRASTAVRVGSGSADGAGPTVTTFVFSDAPSPVRRDVAGVDAPRAAAGRVPAGFNPYGLKFAAGAYRCELGRSVQVRTVSGDLRTAVLRWGADEYTLRAVDARSGALRYEDPASGLAWIVLREASMLLDMRAGQRLANACRA